MMARNINLFNLAAVSALLLSCVQAAPTTKALELHDRGSGCANDAGGVHIISARGSTEPAGEGQLYRVSDIIKGGIAGSDSVGVDYPATLYNYQSSVDQGVAALTQEIESYVARCPRSRIVLQGYSQGAQVVMNTICGSMGNNFGFATSPRLREKLWKHIAAVLVYADPSHLAGQSYDVGTSYLNGMFPRVDPSLCQPFAKRIQAYCDENDPVCASGWDGNVHTGYFDKYNSQAGAWLVHKASHHLPWTRHH